MIRTSLQEFINLAEELTANTVPVLILQHGKKAPRTNPENGSWLIVSDPDLVELAIKQASRHQLCNLGILLGEEKESPLVALGVDLYKDRTAADTVKKLGVTTHAAVWAMKTGRGGITLIYYNPGLTLKRDTQQQGSSIDLLVNGYTVCPPSSSHREPQGGGPYSWLPGHSPYDIPYMDLETPPKDLIVWWQSLAIPAPKTTEVEHKSKAQEILAGPVIPEGSRNETMAKLYGYLRRFLPGPEAAYLIEDVNRARCRPPLDNRELAAIISSIDRRESSSHTLRPVPRISLEGVK